MLSFFMTTAATLVFQDMLLIIEAPESRVFLRCVNCMRSQDLLL